MIAWIIGEINTEIEPKLRAESDEATRWGSKERERRDRDGDQVKTE